MTAPVVSLLTYRQRRVLEVIRDYAQLQGYPPSVRDVAVLVGLSPSATQYQIDQLVVKGWIRRHPNRPRALVVLNPADGTDT